MIATGTAAMPGTDVVAAVRVIGDELESARFIPQLPARGVTAASIGRSLAFIDELSADLQPSGWRLTDAPGIDQRRAGSHLAADLDLVEEQWQAYSGTVKDQVIGPLTLAASVGLPRGEKVLADHGARRELAEALAEAIERHVAGLRRRFPAAQIVIEIDEPKLPAVLSAQVSTASGYGKLRRLDPPAADAALRLARTAIERAGAVPVARASVDPPVALLSGAGFAGIACDALRTAPDDEWARALDAGIALWLGMLSPEELVSASPDRRRAAGSARDALQRFVGRLGFDPNDCAARLVLTPAGDETGSDLDSVARAFATLSKLAAEFDR